jgi:hypothetical protein
VPLRATSNHGNNRAQHQARRRAAETFLDRMTFPLNLSDLTAAVAD